MTEHGAAELVAPEPGDIVESLRDFGYTLPTALADLIDNSLTASAGSIDVTISASPEPTDSSIVVLDDGVSMEASTLVEAMRLGTRGPLARRGDADLGRFGLGLKTAALSQGRCLTVITKTVGGTHPIVRRWDLDHIQKTRLWQLLDVPTALGEDVVSLINEKRSGTAVVIEKLDRPSFLRVPASTREEHLGSALNRIRRHLAMVFHRFIERGVSIRLGTTELAPWDPFCRKHSRQLPAETLFLGEGRIVVTPYVLPHHSKLTDEEHADAAGPRGWNAHQGFYIYRCERLIVPGTWLNLGLRNEEHFKLARIQVDLPNDLDTEWQLNVMKSHVAAPASLRDDVKRIAAHVRREAYGGRLQPSTDIGEKGQLHPPTCHNDSCGGGRLPRKASVIGLTVHTLPCRHCCTRAVPTNRC